MNHGEREDVSEAMIGRNASLSAADTQAAIRLQLARGEAIAEAAEAAMRSSLAHAGASLVSAEATARVASMLRCIALRVLAADGGQQGSVDLVQEFVSDLANNGALLRHLHALALEFALGERLRTRFLLDPVAPPLLIGCLAGEGDRAIAARRVLQMQAASVEAQRRMEVAPADLPRSIVSSALAIPGRATDESLLSWCSEDRAARPALLAELLGATDKRVRGVLEMGPALFLTAVASASGRERTEVALATAPGQQVRLALILSAAGMEAESIERELTIVYGATTPLPAGLALAEPDAAVALLRKAN